MNDDDKPTQETTPPDNTETEGGDNNDNDKPQPEPAADPQPEADAAGDRMADIENRLSALESLTSEKFGILDEIRESLAGHMLDGDAHEDMDDDGDTDDPTPDDPDGVNMTLDDIFG